MGEYTAIAERFARETSEHVMTIRHDDGLYRHLRFRHPKHGSYRFDLITVPHALIFRGDGENYVFDRIDDMFQFFRSGIYADGSHHINPHYWSEKLTTDRDSVMKYDQDLFERTVKEHVADAILDRSAPRGISKAVKELLENSDIAWEEGARRALEEFEHGAAFKAWCVCGASEMFADDYDARLWKIRHRSTPGAHNVMGTEAVEGFRFEDTWEWTFKDYHWWFLWACQAICWGIAQYDRAKGTLAVETVAVPGGEV